jgi:prepilin-type N-terminal cleavage/methylation domain-containing protein
VNPKQIHGITLIELLVVVAIVGVIAAIGVPAYNGYVSNARSRDAQMTLRTVIAAQENYRLLNGGYATVSTNCANPVAGQCNCPNATATAATSCTPSLITSSNISNCLLRGVPVNTQYYYYCTYANNSVVPALHVAIARDIKTNTTFIINQNGQTTGF